MLATTLIACNKKKADNGTVLVMTVNDSKLYLDEVLYQVYETELDNSDYAKSYENQYGKSYWDSEIVDGVTTKDSLKDELKDTLLRDALLYSKAVEEGYTLTDEEKDTCKENAKNALNTLSDDEIQTIGADEDLLVSIYEKNALIEKYFDALLDTFSVDEDEVTKDIKEADYVQYDVQTLYFSKTDYDEDGNEVEKSQEEDEMGYASLKEVLEQAKETDDLYDLIADDPAPTLETEDFSFIIGDGSCETEIEEAVSDMKVGDTSDIIETDTGYYIVRLNDNSSQESYDDAKNNAIQQAKYEQFDEFYNTLEDSASVETTDEWDKVVIGGTVIQEEQ